MRRCRREQCREASNNGHREHTRPHDAIDRSISQLTNVHTSVAIDSRAADLPIWRLAYRSKAVLAFELFPSINSEVPTVCQRTLPGLFHTPLLTTTLLCRCVCEAVQSKLRLASHAATTGPCHGSASSTRHASRHYLSRGCDGVRDDQRPRGTLGAGQHSVLAMPAPWYQLCPVRSCLSR